MTIGQVPHDPTNNDWGPQDPPDNGAGPLRLYNDGRDGGWGPWGSIDNLEAPCGPYDDGPGPHMAMAMGGGNAGTVDKHEGLQRRVGGPQAEEGGCAEARGVGSKAGKAGRRSNQ